MEENVDELVRLNADSDVHELESCKSTIKDRVDGIGAVVKEKEESLKQVRKSYLSFETNLQSLNKWLNEVEPYLTENEGAGIDIDQIENNITQQKVNYAVKIFISKCR